MKIKPHLPPWAKPGCTVIETWEEPITSGSAKGISTWVRYKDKMGKEREMEKWVRWERQVGPKQN